MKTSAEKIVQCLDEKYGDFKQSITILSKTDANEFIVDDMKMFDWDEISKLFEGDDSSSVDAIYLSMKKSKLTIYLFEFKKDNLFDSFFDAKKQLKNYINDLDEWQCCFCVGILYFDVLNYD